MVSDLSTCDYSEVEMKGTNISDSKRVFMLIGAKGSGKTYIGNLLEKSLGIHFIRVEQRLIERLATLPVDYVPPPHDGYDLEMNWIDEALLTRDEVISEATGSSPFLPGFLKALSEKYDLKLIRVFCPLDICFDRIKNRTAENHFVVSDEKIREINTASHTVNLSWTIEIDNAGPAEDHVITTLISDLRA